MLGLYDICFTHDVWWSIKACVYSSMEATFSAIVLWHFLCYNRPNHVVRIGTPEVGHYPCVVNCSKYTSLAVLKPKTCLGRSFRYASTETMVSSVTVARSVFFGMK